MSASSNSISNAATSNSSASPPSSSSCDLLVSSEKTLFSQREEVLRLISKLIHHDSIKTKTDDDGKDIATIALGRIRVVLDSYLEFPTLLDPHLDALLSGSSINSGSSSSNSICSGGSSENITDNNNISLLCSVRRIIHSNFYASNEKESEEKDQDQEHVQDCDASDKAPQSNITDNDKLSLLCSVIYALCKVCGRKKIIRFLPHEASDVEPVLHALRRQQQQKQPQVDIICDSFGGDGGAQAWETTYVLLTWMEMLSLVPFDLNTIDSHCHNHSSANNITLVQSIIETTKFHFIDAGPTREAAAACLASFLIRTDLAEVELFTFVNWCADRLVRETSDPLNQHHHTDKETNTTSSGATHGVFQVIGIIHTLAIIYKTASQRGGLLQCIEILWEPLILLSQEQQEKGQNTLLRKFLVKLFARVGCAYLPPKVASWRYQRGKRSLMDNLASTNTNTVSQGENTASTKTSTSSYNKTLHQSEFKNSEQTATEAMIPCNELEDVIDQLLNGLRDPSTMIRWSSAKGIGRVTERLPILCASDVIEAILDLCSTASNNDKAWHGACLAFAELSRRGLILPSKLPTIIPIIIKAMHYDVRRNQHGSVGSHVRDAACYACWAFARAYSPQDLQGYVVKELGVSMVLTSLFDREINCRRAASAAFQECVGRQGAQNFKHGIDILTKADYFTIGNRVDAYTTIACGIAQHDEYRIPIINHVYLIKLRHWDFHLRTLASISLGKLTRLDKAYVGGSKVLGDLVEFCTNTDDLVVRHGAVLGVAEVVLALSQADDGYAIDEDMLMNITNLVSDIEKKRLYRGRGGEMMRGAVCRLIECIALSKLHLTVKQQVKLLDTVDSCIKHPNETIQSSAISALHALTRNYFPVSSSSGPSERLQKRVVKAYVDYASKSDNAAWTRGFCLALGALPSKLVACNQETLNDVLSCLCNAAHPDSKVGQEGDAETRRNAIIGLSDLCATVRINHNNSTESSYPCVSMSKSNIQLVFQTLLISMEDYNMDRRGDVGSWCRIEAIKALESLVNLAVDASKCTPHNIHTTTFTHASIATTANKNDNDNKNAVNPSVPNMAQRIAFFKQPNALSLVKNSLEKKTPVHPNILSQSQQSDDEMYFNDKLCKQIIGSMLKQLSEKLDAVRLVAGQTLQRLLTNPNMLIPFIPQRYILIEALQLKNRNMANNIINFGAPSETFPLMMKAVNIEQYFEYIISGMVISVGGITESVVKCSSSSFFEWIRALKKVKATGRIGKLGNVLIKLFARHPKDDRVILPLLNTLDKLFSHGYLDGLLDSENSPFPETLVECLKMEYKGCCSIKRLMAIVCVLMGLLDAKQDGLVKKQVLPFAMILLGHRYPRIRRWTAEQLYVKFLEDDSYFIGTSESKEEDVENENEGQMLLQEQKRENYNEVLRLLLQVAWDDELDSPSNDQDGDVRKYRNHVADLLGVELPEKVRVAGKKLKQNREETEKDELESYMSLVNEAGR